MKHLRICLVAALSLTACASAPSYRSASSATASGYSEQVIEKDRYRVQYRLKGSDKAAARDYALLRAGELTLEKGYSTFELVSQESETVREDSAGFETGLERDYAITRDCGLLSCQTRTVPTYSGSASAGTGSTKREAVVTLEILMSDKDASVSPRLYDASEVVANLRQQ